MNSTQVREMCGAVAPQPVGKHLVNCLLVVLVAVALLLVDFSAEAEAAKRRRRGSSRHSRAAAAQARKQQMIKSIQQQVAVARQVLDAAESQAAMSQAQVNQALSKLSGIREDIERGHDDAEQAAKTLHGIEAEILAEQQPDSDLVRAQAILAEAKDDMHDAMHRLIRLPDVDEKPGDAARLTDLANLSPVQRKLLENDNDYQAAQDQMREAGRNVDQVRQKLLRAESNWVAARQDLAEARRRSRDESQQAKTAGLSSLGDRQDLRKAQDVATAARTIIAKGEALLRQLEEKSSSSNATSSGSTPKK